VSVPVRPIVDTDWLAENLQDPRLRVLDCHARSRPAEDGSGHVFESGRDHYERGHIPGAVFADLVNELSRRDTDLPLMLPGRDQFAEVMGGYGVGEGVRVVLYDASVGLWAARVWWMLRAYGFDAASVLDGGWFKWRKEGRPVSTEVPQPTRARFVARVQPQVNASRADVVKAIEDPRARVVGALDPSPDSIALAASMPGASLINPETNALLPREQLRSLAAEAGLLDAGSVVTYCDAGAMASLDALVLTMLGHADVAVYDGSLAEWNREPRGPEIAE
jgi:thiosulfate/3-mercaptopyruvate sulfurtransferase